MWLKLTISTEAIVTTHRPLGHQAQKAQREKKIEKLIAEEKSHILKLLDMKKQIVQS